LLATLSAFIIYKIFGTIKIKEEFTMGAVQAIFNTQLFVLPTNGQEQADYDND